MRRGLASRKSGRRRPVESRWHEPCFQGGSSCDMVRGQKLENVGAGAGGGGGAVSAGWAMRALGTLTQHLGLVSMLRRAFVMASEPW